MDLLMKINTIQLLNKRNIPYMILETRQAITQYNKMVAEGLGVGGLFHSTC